MVPGTQSRLSAHLRRRVRRGSAHSGILLGSIERLVPASGSGNLWRTALLCSHFARINDVPQAGAPPCRHVEGPTLRIVLDTTIFSHLSVEHHGNNRGVLFAYPTRRRDLGSLGIRDRRAIRRLRRESFPRSEISQVGPRSSRHFGAFLPKSRCTCFFHCCSFRSSGTGQGS